MSAPRYIRANDKKVATHVMVWFLVNLLLFPGVGFLVLMVIFLRRGNDPGLTEDGRTYIRIAFLASCIGGSLIIFGCGLFYLWVADPAQAWPLIIVYFTIMHSVFILWGILNLARAMAGRPVARWGIELP